MAKTHRGGRFASFTIQDLLILEIFAGTARLSKTARDAGLQVIPIDKTSDRASQIQIALYDLTEPVELQSLTELLRSEAHRILAVHFAPACGTASRAREKKLTGLQSQGFRVPQPLRSESQPAGLDKLSGVDKIRTETANLVYEATAALVSECHNLDILCSLENPENSLFWFFPDVNTALQKIGGYSVSFHHCMHGGTRNKLTKWWSNKDVFGGLAVVCDNRHTHAKWTPLKSGNKLTFPTAQEAAYPFLLCQRVVAALLQFAIAEGATQPVTLQEQVSLTDNTSHRWILDMLPKGKKLRPLVSEFCDYSHFVVHVACEPEHTVFFKKLLKGARITSRRIEWGFFRVDYKLDTEETVFWVSDGIDHPLGKQHSHYPTGWSGEPPELGTLVQAEFCTVGIPREPWDFVQRAMEVGHPRSLAVHLNSAVTNMLRANFEGELFRLVKDRALFLAKWTKRSRELREAEASLHAKLAPHLQAVLKGKNLLILGEMLRDLEYPDRDLVEDICNGFKLSGWLKKSNVFPARLKRPSNNLETAKKLAKGVNHSICKQVAKPNDPELEAEVWRLTQEEIDKGWVWLDKECNPEEQLLAKRFGLKQGEKTRLIDDCSVGGFNGTCGSSEKLKVHAVDEIAAYIAWCLTNLPDHAFKEVVGKTYDLKSAYKQYGVHPGDRDQLRIAVWDPESKQVRFLGINSLPFGAVGSVSAFLRVSMAIWFVGVCGLGLCWTSFFDDYTVLSKKASANSAAIAAEGLFRLLGIDYATEGKKAVEWDTKVKTLGVVLDLKPELSQGDSQASPFVTVGHTPSRVAELSKTLDEVLSAGSLSLKNAERLRGRLQWFETFASGRVAQQSLRTLSRLASAGRKNENLNRKEIEAVKFLRHRVLTAPPTKIQASSLDTWLIFSDGACEGDETKEGTMGAVLISPHGAPISFFSETVPESVMDFFLTKSSHPIFELELLPVVVACQLWETHLQKSQCVFYLDNEAARGALIHGTSPQDSGDFLVQKFVWQEMKCQVKVWFGRVPTSSNVADRPSRLDTSEMDSLGVPRTYVNWQLVEAMVKQSPS